MNDNDFFSINRLVEFGLGLSVARQMISVMNATMRNMYVPGSIQSMPKAQPSMYYVVMNGQQVGPLNDSELTHLIHQQRINKDTMAWMPGMPEWLPIEQVPAILKLIALTPPPIPAPL